MSVIIKEIAQRAGLSILTVGNVLSRSAARYSADTRRKFTLALGLQNLQSQTGGTPWHHLMAASVLVIAPVLVLFFLAQKTFVEGISTTGMKG